MPVRSLALGVSGIADAVELHAGEDGVVRPMPVEYKRGRPKAHRADEVQLCAQAMALEEMFVTDVPEGALFYGKTRRRQAVTFDDELRALTRTVAAETRALIESGVTPPPVYEKRKCESCSLLELCRPRRLARRVDVAGWIARQIDAE